MASFLAVVIVHGQEGLKPLANTVQTLRGYDIVSTTPETICTQIRNWKKACTVIASGGSAEVLMNGFGLVGVAPSKNVSRVGRTKKLEPDYPLADDRAG